MNKILRNKNGLTLIELLATVTLTSLIFIFAGSLLVKGINHYNNISTEIALRDEADIIMSNLVRTLYTTKESNIINHLKLPESGTSNYYLEIKSGNSTKKTGFIEQKLVIDGKQVFLENSSIEITKESKIEKVTNSNNSSMYHVILTLKMKNKNKQMVFENDIRTIFDTKKIREENP